MKFSEISLRKEPYKSFVFHIEKEPFAPWHHHSQYEIVLITKGKGKKMIGDNVTRFQTNDLVFLGPSLGHQWICDEHNNDNEAFVIQFEHDFLGNKFFEVPENLDLKTFLIQSTRGYEILGKSRSAIGLIMKKMAHMDDVQQFYALFNIFEKLGSIPKDEKKFLASPMILNKFLKKDHEPMQLVMQYILQNFQNKIKIDDLLEITNMSYPSFYLAFKKAYKIPFKNYLLNVRIGYACKLLIEGVLNIAEVAYESGFENLSNFNRQFKKVKKISPSQYKAKYNKPT